MYVNYQSLHYLTNDMIYKKFTKSNFGKYPFYTINIDLASNLFVINANQSGISFHMDTPSENSHTSLMARIQETAFL
jgi:hypothetical protein